MAPFGFFALLGSDIARIFSQPLKPIPSASRGNRAVALSRPQVRPAPAGQTYALGGAQEHPHGHNIIQPWNGLDGIRIVVGLFAYFWFVG